DLRRIQLDLVRLAPHRRPRRHGRPPGRPRHSPFSTAAFGDRNRPAIDSDPPDQPRLVVRAKAVGRVGVKSYGLNWWQRTSVFSLSALRNTGLHPAFGHLLPLSREKDMRFQLNSRSTK